MTGTGGGSATPKGSSRILPFVIAQSFVAEVGAGAELFPADELAPGEQVLYAVRPSFAKSFWGRTVLLGLFLLLLLSPALEGDVAYLANPAALFFIALTILFLAVVYLQWTHAVCALTNQRLIRVTGWRGGSVEAIPIASVGAVSTGSASGGSVDFEYSVQATPSRLDPSGWRTKRLVWAGLANPLAVSGAVESLLRRAQSAARVASGQVRAEEQVAERTVACPYCGTLVPLSAIDRQRPVCPSCAAPLTLPDLPAGSPP